MSSRQGGSHDNPVPAGHPDIDAGAPSSRPHWERFTSLTGVLLLLALLFIISVPGSGRPPALTTLDADWTFALHDIFAQRLQFGSDITFTYGPWGFLLFRYAHPGTEQAFFLGRMVMFGGLILLWWRVSQRVPSYLLRSLLCSAVVVSGAAAIVDGFIYASCAALSLSRPPSTGRLPIVGSVAIAAGFSLISWSKFPFFVAVAGAMVVLAFRAFSEHWRLILLPLLWSVLMPVVWLCAGQKIAGIQDYMRWVAHLSQAYAEAAGTSTFSLSTSMFAAIGFFVVAALLSMMAVRRVVRPLPIGGFLVALAWLVTKAGFIRHDEAHQTIAASYLVYFVVLVAVFGQRETGPIRLAVPLALLAALMMGAFGTSHTSPAPFNIGRVARFIEASARDVTARPPKALLSAPPGCAGGPVETDSYSGGQTLLVTTGAIYRPRPTIQSYVAFTPELAELNRLSLVRTLPQRLLFSIEPIDGRYPHHEDGRSWSTIWRHYRPTAARCGDFVELIRNDSLLDSGSSAETTRLITSVVRIGEWADLPRVDGREIELRLQPRLTTPGALVAGMLRSPILKLTLAFEDGTQRTFRVIPRLLPSGILVQPAITSTEDFVSAGWGDPRSLHQPIGYRVDSEDAPFSAWRRELPATLVIRETAHLPY